MGSYTFRYEHPADEVHVTGTFDNWGKTVLLEKSGSVHSKTVELPKSEEKILYKFVVDGDWKTDPTGKVETDHEGNVNNVLYPDDIKSSDSSNAKTAAGVGAGAGAAGLGAAGLGAAAIPSVAPGSSTTKMAGEQPLESSKDASSSSPPGAFPETPANENNQTFGVDPLPATGGIGNPVSLQPGEKVPEPSTVTGNTTTSNVKLDKESYEKSDAGAPVLPAPLSPNSEQEAAGSKAIFGGAGPVIPESSLPMGKDMPQDINSQDTGPVISSVAPQSTTNQLAGMQPLESQHSPPPIVTESQKEAHVDPEASASPRAVQEKDEVENELHSKVPEAPAVSESPATAQKTENGVLGMAAGGLAAAGAAAGGAALYANSKAEERTGTSMLPQSVQDSIKNMNSKVESDQDVATSSQATPGAAMASDAALPQQTVAGDGVKVPAEANHERETANTVPEEVVTSQKEAHVDPEASASPQAVQEKNAVESELMSKVPESNASGEPAPDAAKSAALSSAAPAATTGAASSSGAPQLGDPTAGVAALSMDDKPAEGSKELNAPAGEPAVPATQESDKLAAPEIGKSPMDSRDVSPMSRPTGAAATSTQDQPSVTTGVDSSKAPTESTSATAGKPVGTPRTGKENTTPQKRQSLVDRFRGTPESTKSAGGASTESSGSKGGEKKKGFLKRLADKLK